MQCQCLTVKGTQCSRKAKEGEFCSQHAKKCPQRVSGAPVAKVTKATKSTTKATKSTTKAPKTTKAPSKSRKEKSKEKPKQRKPLDLFTDLFEYISELVKGTVAEKPEHKNDFDHLHPIPQVAKGRFYLYAQGASPMESRREWILRPGDKVRAYYFADTAPEGARYDSENEGYYTLMKYEDIVGLTSDEETEMGIANFRLDADDAARGVDYIFRGTPQKIFLDWGNGLAGMQIFYDMETQTPAQIRQDGKVVFNYDYKYYDDQTLPL